MSPSSLTVVVTSRCSIGGSTIHGRGRVSQVSDGAAWSLLNPQAWVHTPHALDMANNRGRPRWRPGPALSSRVGPYGLDRDHPDRDRLAGRRGDHLLERA